MSFEQVESCRNCDSKSLLEVLDLGQQPLANSLRVTRIAVNEEIYPLRLIQCQECGLLQLDVNVNPSLMFNEYNWVTGTSPTSVNYCRNLIKKLKMAMRYDPSSVLEIGSNDGTLLRELIKEKIATLVGVEPASNLTSNYGSEIQAENLFFDSSSANYLVKKYGHFNVVIARNVFSHIPNFKDAIYGVTKLVNEESIFVMEFHWAYEILRGVHYDSIYHEHTYYHSIASVEKILIEFGLIAFDAFESPISGGSVVLVASKKLREPSANLMEMKHLEKNANLKSNSVWRKFGSDAIENISFIRDQINSFAGKKICGFGASARSATILNAVGASQSDLVSIGDNNPNKWGKFSPGGGILIEPIEKMIERKPNLIILFPFNFKDEIIEQFLQLGWSGKVLLPVPHPSQILEV